MKKLFGSKEFVIGLSVIISLVVLFFGIDYLKGINMLRPSNFYYEIGRASCRERV